MVVSIVVGLWLWVVAIAKRRAGHVPTRGAAGVGAGPADDAVAVVAIQAP